MYKKIIWLSFILSIAVSSYMHSSYSHLLTNTSEARIGGVLVLFFIISISLYLAYLFFRSCINIRNATWKNIFEKVFNNKIIWPYIWLETKEAFTKTYVGRTVVVVYPIIFIGIWYFIVTGVWKLTDYKEVFTLIWMLIVFLVIPYKLMLPLLLSLKKYICWER